ncbi:hypothetical protein [Nonomuraea cavernae]|uniref:Uncharacterized protein n=1 Tax=Nonomuraea cavernae TaxID=2045107 RepID=A0A917YR01_9ACTN|nr:hypothetical protein [Nonomuraea cavernae]MCA2184701.1 hypothetical protein [Nonomuraea cavernae]GGO63020.1 hypothetical protein GCM10012289_08960 [Nonomuraea cavernae]
MSAWGYITRDEIAEVAGLLCARPGQPSETVAVQATTINGTYENALCLERAWVEIRTVLDGARRDAEHYEDDWRDHMPDRPELFEVEYHNYDLDTETGQKTYSHVEDYNEAEDRRVALDIIRALAARYPLTTEERNSL